MGYLFVTESSAKVSFEENTFSVKKKDGDCVKQFNSDNEIKDYIEKSMVLEYK